MRQRLVVMPIRDRACLPCPWYIIIITVIIITTTPLPHLVKGLLDLGPEPGEAHEDDLHVLHKHERARRADLEGLDALQQQVLDPQRQVRRDRPGGCFSTISTVSGIISTVSVLSVSLLRAWMRCSSRSWIRSARSDAIGLSTGHRHMR
jgi:hypothetical protein